MASPGATAPVEVNPLICRCTSSAVRGPPLRVARGGRPGVRAGSTYQGTTCPVSSKYTSLPRNHGSGPWPKGSFTACASAPDSHRRIWSAPIPLPSLTPPNGPLISRRDTVFTTPGRGRSQHTT